MSEIAVNQLALALNLSSLLAVQTPKKTITAVEFMLIGLYAPFLSKKRDEFTVDVLCWLRVGNQVKPLILMAYGDNNIQRINELEPFHVYATNIHIDDNSIKGDVYKEEPDDDSTFREVKVPTWLKETKEERIEQVFKFYPIMPLRDTEKHLSMLEKNGKGYVDRTDIKGVEVSINSIAWDRDVATLLVHDPTRQEFLQAHVSRMLLMKAQTGEGSTVKLLGTLESGYSTFMNVCCMLPLERMPLIEPSERVLNISAE
jgi:hypothetical protein